MVLLVTVLGVSCDGLVSHPERTVILLVASCWVSCNGQVSYLRVEVILLVIYIGYVYLVMDKHHTYVGYPVMG